MDKVYLLEEQSRLLRRLAEGLGIGESKVFASSLHGIAKSISLITETLHKTK